MHFLVGQLKVDVGEAWHRLSKTGKKCYEYSACIVSNSVPADFFSFSGDSAKSLSHTDHATQAKWNSRGLVVILSPNCNRSSILRMEMMLDPCNWNSPFAGAVWGVAPGRPSRSSATASNSPHDHPREINLGLASRHLTLYRRKMVDGAVQIGAGMIFRDGGTQEERGHVWLCSS